MTAEHRPAPLSRAPPTRTPPTRTPLTRTPPTRTPPTRTPPDDTAFAAFLDAHAPFGPAPLCPEVSVFHARSLVAVWEAAERLAGGVLDAPFWAYPWAGGLALARVLLDRPGIVRGRRVLDVGAGGGVAALAAARAGAAAVTANDIDDWALATIRLAARRQELHVGTLRGDLTREPSFDPGGYDVLLCSEIAYERSGAAPQRALLERARAAGLTVLLADAGRTYFDPLGCAQLAAVTLPVPRDLEGVTERTARVFCSSPAA